MLFNLNAKYNLIYIEIKHKFDYVQVSFIKNKYIYLIIDLSNAYRKVFVHSTCLFKL